MFPKPSRGGKNDLGQRGSFLTQFLATMVLPYLLSLGGIEFCVSTLGIPRLGNVSALVNFGLRGLATLAILFATLATSTCATASTAISAATASTATTAGSTATTATTATTVELRDMAVRAKMVAVGGNVVIDKADTTGKVTAEVNVSHDSSQGILDILAFDSILELPDLLGFSPVILSNVLD